MVAQSLRQLGFPQTFFGPSAGKSTKPPGASIAFSIGFSQQIGVWWRSAIERR